MYVRLTADRRVILEDRNNFRAFKLVIDGRREELESVRRALAGTAKLADVATAWVSQTGLRSRPEVANDAAWQASFAAMIEKAKPHGWIDEQRQAIKAHVEWTG